MSNTCQAPNLTANYYNALDVASAASAERLVNTSTELQFENISGTQAVAFIVNTINQMCLLFMVIGLSWKCVAMQLKRTAMHAFLCTLGFILMMAEGLMTRYSSNPFMFACDAEARTTVHVVLQLLGGALGIIGTLQKSIEKKRHFTTTHGKFGLATCIFCALNFIAGFGALYSESFRYYITPAITKILHSILGLITFFMSVLAQYYGYDSGFFRRNFNNPKVYKGLTVLILLLTAIGPVEILVQHLISLRNSNI